MSLQPLKLVVSGPVGSGKTTFIQTLSETAVVSTDEQASEDIGKASTTVAMDFGTVHIDDTLLFLFGTPGQERFDFMWDVLCEGALGLLVLVSASKPSDFRHSRHILEFISSRYSLPYIVGVTHRDEPDAWAAEDVGMYFDAPEDLIIGCDARDRRSAEYALSTLLTVIHDQSDPRIAAAEQVAPAQGMAPTRPAAPVRPAAAGQPVPQGQPRPPAPPVAPGQPVTQRPPMPPGPPPTPVDPNGPPPSPFRAP